MGHGSDVFCSFNCKWERYASPAMKADEERRQEIVRLREENARLQAIVDKLAKCWRLDDDGKLVRDVPAAPGMTVDWLSEAGEILPYQVVGAPIALVGTHLETILVETEDGYDGLLASCCYSTKAAAEAAKEKKA